MSVNCSDAVTAVQLWYDYIMHFCEMYRHAHLPDELLSVSVLIIALTIESKITPTRKRKSQTNSTNDPSLLGP